jgi:hypothetical protein
VLEQLFAGVPSKPVINYCNTGHQAATNWFVCPRCCGGPAFRSTTAHCRSGPRSRAGRWRRARPERRPGLTRPDRFAPPTLQNFTSATPLRKPSLLASLSQGTPPAITRGGQDG